MVPSRKLEKLLEGFKAAVFKYIAISKCTAIFKYIAFSKHIVVSKCIKISSWQSTHKKSELLDICEENAGGSEETTYAIIAALVLEEEKLSKISLQCFKQRVLG